MRRMMMPVALCSLLASTVGCAQRMPTAPAVPAPDLGATTTVSDTRQIQADDGMGSTRMTSARRSGSMRMTSGRRSGSSMRRMGHAGMRKHKFLFFKGVYVEVDSPAKMGQRRMDTTKRRGSTSRRSSTGRRHKSSHSWASLMD